MTTVRSSTSAAIMPGLSSPALLSRVSDTSARPRAGRFSVPAKMTSALESARLLAGVDVLLDGTVARGRFQGRNHALTELADGVRYEGPGFDVTLDPSFTMMFRTVEGRRRAPLADGEVCEDPRELSPGVLIRPLWQDAVLPSIGFRPEPEVTTYGVFRRP